MVIHRVIVGFTHAAAFIAMSVIIGWYLKIPELIAWIPTTAYAPMQFNAGVYMLLASLSFYLLYSKYVWLVRATSILLITLASLTFLSYMIPSISVESLLYSDWWYTNKSHPPGRMSPILALVLIFHGLYSLASTLKIEFVWKMALTSGLCACSLLLTALPLLSFLTPIDLQPGTNLVSSMSIPAAVSGLLLSTAKTLYVRHLCGKQ